MTQLSYCLVVTSPVYGHQGSVTALNFAKALVEKGECLATVFFYQEGVSNALASLQPAADEFDAHQAWGELQQQADCQLLVCSAAAYRRGVVAEEEGADLLATMQAPFQMAGLAEMAMASLQADRVVKL